MFPTQIHSSPTQRDQAEPCPSKQAKTYRPSILYISVVAILAALILALIGLVEYACRSLPTDNWAPKPLYKRGIPVPTSRRYVRRMSNWNDTGPSSHESSTSPISDPLVTTSISHQPESTVAEASIGGTRMNTSTPTLLSSQPNSFGSIIRPPFSSTSVPEDVLTNRMDVSESSSIRAGTNPTIPLPQNVSDSHSTTPTPADSLFDAETNLSTPLDDIRTNVSISNQGSAHGTLGPAHTLQSDAWMLNTNIVTPTADVHSSGSLLLNPYPLSAPKNSTSAVDSRKATPTRTLISAVYQSQANSTSASNSQKTTLTTTLTSTVYQSRATRSPAVRSGRSCPNSSSRSNSTSEWHHKEFNETNSATEALLGECEGAPSSGTNIYPWRTKITVIHTRPTGTATECTYTTRRDSNNDTNWASGHYCCVGASKSGRFINDECTWSPEGGAYYDVDYYPNSHICYYEVEFLNESVSSTLSAACAAGPSFGRYLKGGVSTINTDGGQQPPTVDSTPTIESHIDVPDETPSKISTVITLTPAPWTKIRSQDQTTIAQKATVIVVEPSPSLQSTRDSILLPSTDTKTETVEDHRITESRIPSLEKDTEQSTGSMLATVNDPLAVPLGDTDTAQHTEIPATQDASQSLSGNTIRSTGSSLSIISIASTFPSTTEKITPDITVGDATVSTQWRLQQLEEEKTSLANGASISSQDPQLSTGQRGVTFSTENTSGRLQDDAAPPGDQARSDLGDLETASGKTSNGISEILSLVDLAWRTKEDIVLGAGALTSSENEDLKSPQASLIKITPVITAKTQTLPHSLQTISEGPSPMTLSQVTAFSDSTIDAISSRLDIPTVTAAPLLGVVISVPGSVVTTFISSIISRSSTSDSFVSTASAASLITTSLPGMLSTIPIINPGRIELTQEVTVVLSVPGTAGVSSLLGQIVAISSSSSVSRMSTHASDVSPPFAGVPTDLALPDAIFALSIGDASIVESPFASVPNTSILPEKASILKALGVAVIATSLSGSYLTTAVPLSVLAAASATEPSLTPTPLEAVILSSIPGSQVISIPGHLTTETHSGSKVLSSVPGSVITVAVITEQTMQVTPATITTQDIPGATITLSVSGSLIVVSSSGSFILTSVPDYVITTTLPGTVASSSTDPRATESSSTLVDTASAFGRNRSDRPIVTMTASKYFLGAYLPIVLAVVLRNFVGMVYAATKMMEPFYCLAKPGGASARDFFNINYLSTNDSMDPFVAMLQGHWLMLLVSFLYFWIGLVTSLSTELLLPTKFCNSNNVCGAELRVIPSIGRIVEALLGVSAIMLVAFGYLQYKSKSGIYSDPSSIATIASLLHNPEVVEDFRRLPPDATKKEIETILSDKRYRLAFYSIENGLGRYGVVLVDDNGQISEGSGRNNPGSSQSENSDSEEQKAKRRKHRRRHRAYRVTRDVAFAILVCGTMALIIIYHKTGEGTDFMDFWAGQGFGPRFVLSLIGMLIHSQWKRIEREVCILEPFRGLAKGQAPARNSILVRRTLHPITTLVMAVWRRQVYPSLVAFTVLLAELLIIALPGIPFRENHFYSAYLFSFWASIVIMPLMLLVMVALYLRPAGPDLPRTPNTIASLCSYLCASGLLDELADLATVDSKTQRQAIERATRTYALKQKPDEDDLTRWTIDYDEAPTEA